jgi:hypothetical protein
MRSGMLELIWSQRDHTGQPASLLSELQYCGKSSFNQVKNLLKKKATDFCVLISGMLSYECGLNRLRSCGNFANSCPLTLGTTVVLLPRIPDGKQRQIKNVKNHIPAEMYRVLFKRMEMVGHRTKGVTKLTFHGARHRTVTRMLAMIQTARRMLDHDFGY